MPAIGITGGISTGKSSVLGILKELLPEAVFFDADMAAHDLPANDPEVRNELVKAFGSDVYSNNGDLNRDHLRSIVFADAGQRRVLEEILHPRIRRQWSELAQRYRGASGFFFADIPLLYETNGQTLCDWVVVVACSPEIQRQRLLVRSRLSPERAEEIIRSQMDLTEKIKRAKHVIWNNDGLELLRRQTETMVKLWRA